MALWLLPERSSELTCWAHSRCRYKKICHKLLSAQAESRKNSWKPSIQSSLKLLLFDHRDYCYIRLPCYLTRRPLLTSTSDTVTSYVCLKIRKSVIGQYWCATVFYLDKQHTKRWSPKVQLLVDNLTVWTLNFCFHLMHFFLVSSEAAAG